MRSRAPTSTGFTLIELAAVVGIIAILTGLAWSSFSRQRPRANLANAAAELQAVIHGARQSALSSGATVAVLVYPSYTANGATGRIIVYQDACFDFFTTGGCGVSFRTYNPAVLATGLNGAVASQVLATMDLPKGIIVGPTTGMGASATLAAPLADVTVNTACSFCGTTAGAAVFNARGQATFYSLSGTTQTTLTAKSGYALSLGIDQSVNPDIQGQRELVILTASGAVQAINGG